MKYVVAVVVRVALIAVVTGTFTSACNSGEVALLKGQLAEAQQRETVLQKDVGALKEELGALKSQLAARDADDHEAHTNADAKNAEHEQTWAAVRGEYRCQGGVLTGMVVRDGFARMKLGALDPFNAQSNFRAEVRGEMLYVTDPVRGAVGFRIKEGGGVLIPQSKIYATSCRRGRGEAQ